MISRVLQPIAVGIKKHSTILSLFCFAVVATIFMYRYGTGNHTVIIPFLKSSLNGDLFLNDYLVEQKSFYITFLWDWYGWLLALLPLEIKQIFFISYFIGLFLSFIGIYLVADLLFKKPEVGFLTIFILVFVFANNPGVGGEYLIPYIFKESLAALPLCVFSVFFFLKDRFYISYFLQGLAFLIHPLTAFYISAILALPFLFKWKVLKLNIYLGSIAIFLLAASPLFVSRAQNFLEFSSMFLADPKWVELLKMRSGYHISPFTWEMSKNLQGLALLLFFFITWKYKPKRKYHKIVIHALLAILILWLLALVFSEWIPLTKVLQLQLFRSYVFLTFFVVLYFSNYVVSLFKTDSFANKAISMGLLLIFAFVQSFEVRTCLFIGVFGILLILLSINIKKELQINYFVFTVLLTSLLFMGDRLRTRGFTIDSWQQTDWIEIQKWAKEHTEVSDMFIVPPRTRGFRVDSERSIFVDWRDGTQMFFNPEFGYEWIARMNSLGFEKGINYTNLDPLRLNYRKLNENDFVAIGKKTQSSHNNIFVVLYKDQDNISFKRVYENKSYIVCEVISWPEATDQILGSNYQNAF